MGIRNSGHSSRWPSSARSHYPSWGSGTRPVVGACAIRGALTTPHGDQEQGGRFIAWDKLAGSLPLMGIRNPPRSCSFASHVVSLPLMGIRNIPPETDSHGAPMLTTPHGDQERLDHCPRSRASLLLTTPHGDQEPSGPRRSVARCGAHYPSWGSGTPSSGCSPGSPPNGSLPLMGIRNGEAGVILTGQSELTTPHGDQERRGEREDIRGRRELTTPHGDQERCQAIPPPAHRHRAHYPSWGSGTGNRVDRQRDHASLTTPHGDQEPAGECRRHLVDGDLTTPHGDQELAKSGSSPPCGAHPHYPSWGSGTLIFRHFSLLMGSGSVHHACADRQTCAWTPGQRWFSAQAHGIPSENGPVFPVPFVFFLAHLSAEFIFSESVYLDVVPILGNEL